jgi:uncharacterized protein HemX
VLETVEQPDLSAIMAKLDSAATGIQNLTKSFTPDTINNLLGPLTDLVKQNSGISAARFPTLITSPRRSQAGRARSANSFTTNRTLQFRVRHHHQSSGRGGAKFAAGRQRQSAAERARLAN